MRNLTEIDELNRSMFFERQRLREQLPLLRQDRDSKSGAERMAVDHQIAESEREIAKLTKGLPSSMR